MKIIAVKVFQLLKAVEKKKPENIQA